MLSRISESDQGENLASARKRRTGYDEGRSYIQGFNKNNLFKNQTAIASDRANTIWIEALERGDAAIDR
jgi:hypothetical protein